MTIDCPGFTPESIKTEVKGSTLTVSGEVKEIQPNGDFHTREFKKTYTLPVNSEPDRLVSFMAMPGTLVVEVPLKDTLLGGKMASFPRIVDGKN